MSTYLWRIQYGSAARGWHRRVLGGCLSPLESEASEDGMWAWFLAQRAVHSEDSTAVCRVTVSCLTVRGHVYLIHPLKALCGPG